jgi:hypothetical protein
MSATSKHQPKNTDSPLTPSGNVEPVKRKPKVSLFPILDFQTKIRRICLKQVIGGVFTARQMQSVLAAVSAEFGMVSPYETNQH